MASEMDNYIKNANGNEGIRKLCSNNENILEEVNESLNELENLIEDILQNMSLQGKLFEMYEPAKTPQINQYEGALVENFDENTHSLTLKSDCSKIKYPKFTEFYDMHCISRTYFFHLFKFSKQDCQWYKPLISGKMQVFGKPVPTVDENTTHYIQGSDPKEKYMPSKLEDPSKRNHGMPFPPTAQTASNVGVLTTCSQCCKLRLIYSKHKLSGKQIASLKRLSNTFMYVCGTNFQDVQLDDRRPDTMVAEKVFIRGNISCKSNIEIHY